MAANSSPYRKLQSAWRRTIPALIFLCTFAAPAKADRIPGTPYVGRAYYASTDIAPVAVHFVEDKPGLTPQSAAQQPIVTSGRVPRGLMIFAVPYSNDTHPILPDEIWTTHLVLLLHENGEPYLAALNALQREQGLSTSAAAASLRTGMATVNVHAVDWERYRQVAVYFGMPNRGSTADGLDIYYYSSGRGPIYYTDSAYPELQIIACATDQARADANDYCTYELRLSEVLLARINFVDFRFHGGRAFVQERLGQLEELLCSYFRCDDPSNNQ